MKIPKKELLKLGFSKYESDSYNTFYENESGMLLEDVNDDGSVDLKYVIMAYQSMGELTGFNNAKENMADYVQNLYDNGAIE